MNYLYYYVRVIEHNAKHVLSLDLIQIVITKYCNAQIITLFIYKYILGKVKAVFFYFLTNSGETK